LNSHYCQMLPGFTPVTEDFQPLGYKSLREIKSRKLALNHYWTRDLAFFKEHKLPRLLAWGVSEDECYRNIVDLNEIEDSLILRWVPQLKSFMDLRSK